jgi:hypothetical protein
MENKLPAADFSSFLITQSEKSYLGTRSFLSAGTKQMIASDESNKSRHLLCG